MRLLRDLSLSAVVAGFVTVLVGFTSSAALVFQAATALGATPAQQGSWMLALGVGMALTCIGLSLRYRAPVVTAWSTPGAAMLIAAAPGVSLAEAVGAFLVCAVLIAVAGFRGWFERALDRIPLSIASAMLAGVLLRFGLEVFVAMQSQTVLVLAIFLGWLLARRWLPRYAVLVALLAGLGAAQFTGQLAVSDPGLRLAQPVLVMPEFTLSALIGVGLPLFVVTMASQNLPGVAVLRASGYGQVPVSPLIGWTGLTTLVLAPFGAYALNLAAITAAICTGREAHEDPARRYPAAVAAGVFYLALGLFGATVAALFAALPQALVLAIAGVALFGTIGGALAGATAREDEREAALLTFLVTASGLTLAGIGSAFWGLLAGALALAVLRPRRG